MGMDRKIPCSADRIPSWQTLVQASAKQGIQLTLRMIDGDLAFPDEQPSETWRELRVSTQSGMISIRREDDGLALVVWGNADASLQRDWASLAGVIEECTAN